jgi:hypothetical protein
MAGIYGIWLNRCGEWIIFVIDDYYPIFKENRQVN